MSRPRLVSRSPAEWTPPSPPPRTHSQVITAALARTTSQSAAASSARVRRPAKHGLGGNRNDVTQLIPLLDAVPPVRGAVGRPRQRPDSVVADRGYDHDKHRRLCPRSWHQAPCIARRQTEHGSGSAASAGSSNAPSPWPHHFKRLLVRYDRRHEMHHAFLAIGCCLVCYRGLENSF